MGVADRRIVGTDDQVAAQDQFQRTGVAVPVDLSDRGLWKRFERVDRLGLIVRTRSLLAGGDGTKIVASTETPPRTLEHNDSHRDSTAHGEGWSLAELRDKIERETDEEDPLVFLMRSGDEVFGAVATEGFMFDGKYNGTSRCMMFSLTRDVLIPFTNRVAEPGVACPAMYSDKDEIRWGGKSAGGDLVLRDGVGAYCS